MNQPAPRKTPQAPPTSEADAPHDEASDLAAQLDALLAQEAEANAGEAEPDAPAPPAPPTPPAPPAPPAPAVDTSDKATADEAPTPAADSGGDEDTLAEQIQTLLDETTPGETQPAVAASLASTDRAADAADDDDEPAGTFASPDELEADAETAAQTEPATPAAASPPPPTAEVDTTADDAPADADADASAETADGKVDDAMLIEQIDQMLSEQAGESLGELHSVEEVLAEPDEASEPAAADAPPDQAATPTDMVASADDADDLDLDGAFETPEDLLDESTDADADAARPQVTAKQDEDDDWASEDPDDAGALDDADGASADDVASELDDQPEQRHARRDAEADHEPAPAAGEATRWRRSVASFERATRHGCALINRPLDYLNPESQKMVGYVAFAVAGPGVAMVLIGLFS
ncbi:MAG: hypothetical protein WD534_10655 [Phycisphaeraceae bacterium]